jgi:hypothetical protein
MSIGRVPDGLTAERRHAGTPPCETSRVRASRGQQPPPPRLAGDTRPSDGGESSVNRGGGEGAWEGKGRLARQRHAVNQEE